MKFFKKYIFLFYLNVILSQLVPYEDPLSKYYQTEITFFNIEEIMNENIRIECFSTSNKESICQVGIKFNEKNLHILELDINQNMNNMSLFIRDNNNNNIYAGPYILFGNIIQTSPLNTDSIIIEINSKKLINNVSLKISNISIGKKTFIKQKNKFYKKNNLREEPIILLTGYWPPTNEMIRHFSQSTNLNPIGWEGGNWEGRGYDIISYFPEFSDPNCSSCGQGFGELEYNAYNRTNWYNDFTSPFQPTPNPPDSNEVAFFLRNSNLPMEGIVEAIDNLNIGLTPYIDINGDPGHYVSEFMAYHGVWYRDLNQFGDDNCISSGHIHVGGYLDWDDAKMATEESIRVLINYIDSFIYNLGDLNQDDIIDILDLVTIVNFVLGNIDFTNLQMYAGDINEDAIINIQDIIMIINIILSD